MEALAISYKMITVMFYIMVAKIDHLTFLLGGIKKPLQY